MAKQKRKFKKVVIWKEESRLNKLTSGYWIFYIIIVTISWTYTVYVYNDNNLLWMFVPWLLYAIIMIVSLREIIYEEV